MHVNSITQIRCCRPSCGSCTGMQGSGQVSVTGNQWLLGSDVVFQVPQEVDSPISLLDKRNGAGPFPHSPSGLPLFLLKSAITSFVYAVFTVVIAVPRWPFFHLVPVSRLVSPRHEPSQLQWLECVWVQPCVCVACILVGSQCWGWVLVKDGGLTHSGRLLRNPQAGGMQEAKAKFCYWSVWDKSAKFWAKANEKRVRLVWFSGFGSLCWSVIPVCKLVRVE